MLANKVLILASTAGAAIIIGVIVYFLAPGVLVGTESPAPVGGESNNTTIVASSGEPPAMTLVLLQGPEDASTAVAQYEANNTEPVELSSGAHIRFDSPDHRTAESIRVVARNLDTGEIELLRKSYDVNNEFFINVGRGHYELQVHASWFDRGSFVYGFNIMVV